MTRVSSARLFSLATLAVLSACSGSGSSTGGVKTGGDFVVLSTEPVDNAQLFLNDPIRIDFSNPIDLDSVDLSTFSFQVFNQIGDPVAEPVAGFFEVGTSPGDADPGRRLRFVPVLPTNDLYTNGGFRPGRTYEVQLVAGNRNNGTVLRDTSGKALALATTFRFKTSDGTTPASLFRNTAQGGPRRTAFEISPQDTSGVALNKLGAPPVEIRLRFDQPLNPASSNVPVAVDTNPLTRNSNDRGRVFLEYDDPTFGNNSWIPADAELESNQVSGATMVLRPLGVLPNNAVVRVIVERTLEDISGESNVASVAYERVFATFKTKRSYEQQFDGLVDNFLGTSSVDVDAVFSEPAGEVGPGYMRAGFNFEGSVTGAVFAPDAPLTVLNTNFTLVDPANGPAFNVSGGVFNFASVNIGVNKTVRGQGTNPMVWLVGGTFEVGGTLSVEGGLGRRVDTSGNANVRKPGGAGVCGGGDGGDGSPSESQRDEVGGTGNGPFQLAGGGGRGGSLSCTAGCGRGAGGGGGSLATQGDPNFKLDQVPAGQTGNPFAIFQQQTGAGGNGCEGAGGVITRNLEGAVAGPTVFVDARNDNNFWGVGVRYDGDGLRITGELATPVGGSGGGGGGDLSFNSDCGVDDPNFENDSSGGGGGGGGGVLIVKALGPIIIRDSGTITADGGNGGGGEPSASSARGGGGGGGSGGMVILMSADSIEINARGGSTFTYVDNDYDFSISADGGICQTGSTQPVVSNKYPASGTAFSTGWRTTYDSAPLGGFGGMGIVQLMVPPGDPATTSDGTNTILDDNIRVFQNGALLPGPAKQTMLAWNGFPNEFGQGVADNGSVINPTNQPFGGDIRPQPVFLPTPFSSKSRLRSKWIDTGATMRRELGNLADEQPRGILTPNGSGISAGPAYEWAGVETAIGLAQGFADFDASQNPARVRYPEVVVATPILNSNANSDFLGSVAYRVRLSQPAMGQIDDRFVQYEAELLASNNAVVGSHRILAHVADELVLSAENGALSGDATQLRVVAKFFQVFTNGQEGLGPTYVGAGGSQDRIPKSNVRIGFAFHTNPQDDNAPRLPPTPGTFIYDLSDPVQQAAVRNLGASFVQWDILFDNEFKTESGDEPLSITPESPRPELRFLRLPFRF